MSRKQTAWSSFVFGAITASGTIIWIGTLLWSDSAPIAGKVNIPTASPPQVPVPTPEATTSPELPLTSGSQLTNSSLECSTTHPRYSYVELSLHLIRISETSIAELNASLYYSENTSAGLVGIDDDEISLTEEGGQSHDGGAFRFTTRHVISQPRGCECENDQIS